MPSDCGSQCSETVYVRPTEKNAKLVVDGVLHDFKKLLKDVEELTQRKETLEKEITKLQDLKKRIVEEMQNL